MRRHVDYPLLGITAALLTSGLFIISSASVVLSERNFGTPYYYLIHQGIAALVGLAGMFIAARIHYRIWRKLALPLLALSVLLMAAVFIPQLGFSFGGAQRWLRLGPISLQPSEILKLSLILYLASWLAKKRGESGGFATAFIPFLIVTGVVATLLVLQPDIGTLIVILGSAAALYFLGGGKISQLAMLAVLAASSLTIIVQLAPYRVNRFLVFFNPELDPKGIGYHLNQALIAIGSGGFWGRGFGQSIQKFSYLPETIGDSIFAVVTEEFGLLGATILAVLFFAFFVRSATVARHTPDVFGKLLVMGIASLISFQAFINMAAISGLLPLTGIPLPFISYGGTALVITLTMVGIMLGVSKQT